MAQCEECDRDVTYIPRPDGSTEHLCQHCSHAFLKGVLAHVATQRAGDPAAALDKLRTGEHSDSFMKRMSACFDILSG